MFAKVNHKVLDLTRTVQGPLKLSGIKTGHWRPLNQNEINAIARL
jgi:16S rRNA U516 pseudouridylate synthase RsuA-like enzyme